MELQAGPAETENGRHGSVLDLRNLADKVVVGMTSPNPLKHGTRLFRKRYSVLGLACLTFFLCFFGAESSPAHPENSDFATGADIPVAGAVPVVIELFTSEGCSSCPPADEFVRKLDVLQPVEGVQFIVLSEHVDYWDHDGWKDPNSSALLTERQEQYERALGVSSPYTPQLIVDGTKEFHITDSRQLETVVQQAKAIPKVGVRIGEVGIDDASPPLLRTRVETDENTGKHDADVFLAVALDHVESQVLRGENGGRHLIHVAVVQQIAKIGKLQKGRTFSEEAKLKLRAGIDPHNLRVIAFVQTPGPGRLLGAALWKAAR